ncbi:MAG: hypothetical protein WDN08_10470 [Rhizomicrobium sp.]
MSEFFKTSDGVTTIGLDFAGRIETLSFIANDGSTKFAQFDRAEVHNWEEIVTDHDIAGNLTMQTATMDNGGTWVNTYDPTDANAMLTDTKHFDPEGQADPGNRHAGRRHASSVGLRHLQPVCLGRRDADLRCELEFRLDQRPSRQCLHDDFLERGPALFGHAALVRHAVRSQLRLRPAGDDPDEQRRHRRALRP